MDPTRAPPATARPSGRPPEDVGLEAVAPLIGAGVGFSTSAAILLAFDPTAGPGAVPLWAILVPAAIAAFLAAGLAWRKGALRVQARPSDFPPEPADPWPAWSESGAATVDSVAAPAAAWDESGLPNTSAAGLPPPPLPRPPSPPDDVEIALQEIARIEEELEARPARPARLPVVPARS